MDPEEFTDKEFQRHMEMYKKDKEYKNKLEKVLRKTTKSSFLPEPTGYYKEEKDDKDSLDVDPLEYFLKTQGMNKKDEIRYVSDYVRIDSRYRIKIPENKIEDETELEVDPIATTLNSSDIVITHEGHSFKENDQIVIKYASTKKQYLKSSAISFTVVSGYVTITGLSHGIPSSHQTRTDIQVIIDGVQGTSTSGTHINNIPINRINGLHTAIFQPFNTSQFHIDIGEALTGTFSPASYNITVKIQAINGIPLNKINANYPTDETQLQGYHVITSVTDNSYTVEIPGILGAVTTGSGGGGGVMVSRIKGITQGYPEPNRYRFCFNKTYNNIAKVKMISSEFFNTIRTVTSYNNTLIWQDLDQGDTKFTVELTKGRYTPSTLQTMIEGIMNDKEKSERSNTNYQFDVDINGDSDVVTFKGLKNSSLYQPFTVSPTINTNPALDPTVLTTYTITVSHSSHGFSTGNTITISNAISYLGISVSDLNKEHTITVIDVDNYSFDLVGPNLSDTRTDTKGGNSVRIDGPFKFRLLFDEEKTIGDVLGFRKVGDEKSITNYGSTIKNSDAYQNEATVDYTGKTITITNNYLQLISIPYFYVICPQLQMINKVNRIKNIFAVIRTDEDYQDLMIDTFIESFHGFRGLKHNLSYLDLSFVDPNGNLMEFDNIDHSFTIEIVTLHHTPDKVSMNSKNNLLT